jgi:hypothetical protein
VKLGLSLEGKNAVRVFDNGDVGEYFLHMVEMRNKHKISVRKPEGKRLFGSHRRNWEDNIKIDLREIR